MSLKKIKKSKLSPWFMPCFSKNGSVDRFIVFSRYTSLAIASFAMLKQSRSFINLAISLIKLIRRKFNPS